MSVWNGPEGDREYRIGKYVTHALAGSAEQIVARLQRIIAEHPDLDPRDIRGSGMAVVGTTHYTLGYTAEQMVPQMRRIIAEHPDLDPDANCGMVQVHVTPGLTEVEADGLQARAEAQQQEAHE